MLVSGVNDGGEELERMSSALKRARAEKIQLSTVERPPAEGSADLRRGRTANIADDQMPQHYRSP